MISLYKFLEQDFLNRNLIGIGSNIIIKLHSGHTTIWKPKIPRIIKSNFSQVKDSNYNQRKSSILRENIPSFSKILVADDGRNETDKMLNYALSLSNYSGAELLILRILENIKNTGDVSVEGRSTDDNMQNKDVNREIKGRIIDDIEERIKKCIEAGCKNKISYKFRTGDATDEIVNEIKEGKYDLLLLKSSNIASWLKSLVSDTKKIFGNIDIPVFLVH